MSRKNSGIGSGSMEKVKERHLQFFRALSNPVRREILRALKEGDATVEILRSRTKLDGKTLEWHLSILERALCVEKENRDGEAFYRLTREGKVVDHLE